MTRSAPSRPALIAAGVIALVLVTILGIDRPLSTALHAAVTDKTYFILLTRIAEQMPVLSGLVLAGSALAVLCGWRPGPWARVVIIAAVATLVAEGLKDELKYVFGRTWPETWTNNNPSWIGNGVFGFFPFHGGPGWSSFPSGHTTVTSAPMTALWLGFRRLLWLWILPVGLVAIGLLGADYHWLSDIIAGAGLGVATAFGVTALTRRVAGS